MFTFFKKLFSRPPLSSFGQKIKDDLEKYPLTVRDVKASKLSWYFTFTHPESEYAIEYSAVGWYGKLCLETPIHERGTISTLVNKQFAEWKKLESARK